MRDDLLTDLRQAVDKVIANGTTLAGRDLEQLSRKRPDSPPPIEWQERVVGIRGPSPRVVKVPRGIDPGWGYNVGKAAWGEPLAQQVMEEWAATRDAREPLITSGWAGR